MFFLFWMRFFVLFFSVSKFKWLFFSDDVCDKKSPAESGSTVQKSSDEAQDCFEFD